MSHPASVTSSSTTLVGSYRRNGKLQSCEPCRKGKLRCDHSLPTCSRCTRRRKPDACVYHPAPLTKGRQPSLGSSRSPPVVTIEPLLSQQPETSHPQTIASPPGTGLVSPSQSSGLDASGSLHSSHHRLPSLNEIGPSFPSGPPQRTGSMSFQDNKQGFLGSSSYSAVFTENRASLGIDAATDQERLSPSPPVSVSHDQIHRGAEVLSHFHDLPTLDLFLNRWFDKWSSTGEAVGIVRPVYRLWFDEIVREFNPLLSTYRQIEELYPLSELIWRNTQAPVKYDGNTTTMQWARLHTGQNLRWETLAAITAKIGTISEGLTDWDDVFSVMRGYVPNRATLTRNMRLQCEECLQFCRDSNSINDVFMAALLKGTVLLEAARGDGDYEAWRRMGEICDLVVVLGYHQEKVPDSRTPFYVNELRIRLMDHIFGRDKTISTFLGRPPRLSYRYCVLQPPTDLTDDQLCLEGEELASAIANLNNGWNPEGHVHDSTNRRAWALYLAVREDILEMTLGTADETNQEEILVKCQVIRERIERANDSIPTFIRSNLFGVTEHLQTFRYPSTVGPGRDRLTPLNIVHGIRINAGVCHAQLLLEKTLMRKIKSGPELLIPKAKALLDLILMAFSKRDFFKDFQIDLYCMLAFHALPAGSILAIELLKQEKSGQYTPDILPRSETIQDLSVLINTLATVGPEEGNYPICSQGRKVLKFILDKILSPETPQLPSPMFDFDQSLFGDLNMPAPTGTDVDFLQWLENAEWDRGSLII